ncbi:hypothetical protein JHK87_001164 [Glycine soja]|nr:hypothetical protein JHK87_001164 [Glycine soja]
MGSLEPSLPLHAVILPFMAKGHTLPLLHLAGVLLGRQPPLSSPKHYRNTKWPYKGIRIREREGYCCKVH